MFALLTKLALPSDKYSFSVVSEGLSVCTCVEAANRAGSGKSWSAPSVCGADAGAGGGGFSDVVAAQFLLAQIYSLREVSFQDNNQVEPHVDSVNRDCNGDWRNCFDLLYLG